MKVLGVDVVETALKAQASSAPSPTPRRPHDSARPFARACGEETARAPHTCLEASRDGLRAHTRRRRRPAQVAAVAAKYGIDDARLVSFAATPCALAWGPGLAGGGRWSVVDATIETFNALKAELSRLVVAQLQAAGTARGECGWKCPLATWPLPRPLRGRALAAGRLLGRYRPVCSLDQ